MKLSALLSSDPRRNPAGYGVLGALVLYVLVIANPTFLFGQPLGSGGIHVYGHDATGGLDRDVALAELALSRSSINDPALPQRFFMTSSFGEYAFFVPSARNGFGVTYAAVGNSFLAPSDSIADVVHANRATWNKRPLSAVIAHERVHLLLAHHFGWGRATSAPVWKQEGYCDYISGGHSVGSDQDGVRLLTSGQAEEPAVLYFRDYLRVKYLIEQKHLSVDQVFAQDFDLADLDREALTVYGKV